MEGSRYIVVNARHWLSVALFARPIKKPNCDHLFVQEM